MADLSVRYRIDFGDLCAIGPGKIALLEHIADSGSLSQAARDLQMSYRRAWLLLESLNTSFRQPATQATTGGRGGGGVTLTAFGLRIIEHYRKFEAELSRHAQRHFAEFAEQIVGKAPASPRRRLVRTPAKTARRKAKPTARAR